MQLGAQSRYNSIYLLSVDNSERYKTHKIIQYCVYKWYSQRHLFIDIISLRCQKTDLISANKF